MCGGNNRAVNDAFIRKTPSFAPVSLPLVFPFVNPLKNGEARFFSIRHGQWLQFNGGIEGGKNLAHRFLASRAICERFGGERSAQGEFPAAHRATAFRQFIFVDWHGQNLA